MATEEGVALGPDWQCGTRFVGVCLSGTSAQAQAHSHQVERQPLLVMGYRWASVKHICVTMGLGKFLHLQTFHLPPRSPSKRHQT